MGSVKLFLVEDQLLMRQAIARALSVTNKYEVVGHSGDCTELLSNPSHCTADVIILDTEFSGQSWLEMLSQLRATGITAPILVLSDNENQTALKAALNAGARGVLPKWSDFGEMEFAIDAVAKGETYVSPQITKADSSQGDGNSSSEVLSPREHEIFLLLAQGKKNREIGKLLSISTRTVDTHRSNILKKLQMRSNAELVRMAISEGFMSI
jgi:DNA-binding NarL/FixJ family response regulator